MISEVVICRGYGVRVKGYSLDPGVKFFKILGVSPKTEAAEIKKTFADIGIGDVIELKKRASLWEEGAWCL